MSFSSKPIPKQVAVQLPTSSDNVVGLSPAFAAERRAAAPLLLAAGRAAIDRCILAVRRTAANPQQRRAAAGWDGRTDRRTPDT